VEENNAEEIVQLVDFEEEGYCKKETLENEHVEENDADELVQLVDFKEEGYCEEETLENEYMEKNDVEESDILENDAQEVV
jgi:hypothetical protein